MNSSKTPQVVLQKYFGFKHFRSGQFEVISSILARKHTLAVLATGAGKSICFQVPGLLLPGTTLVISPLISLMKDQVDALSSKGIAATYINSSLTTSEQQRRLLLAKQGRYKFLYVSPERLATQKFATYLATATVPLVVIDEAHCISEWGDDFRPSYKKIRENLQTLKSSHTLVALTATATAKVQHDIITTLQLAPYNSIVQTAVRTNLALVVHLCSNTLAQELALLRILKKHKGEAGIVYTATRTQAATLAAKINQYYSHQTAFANTKRAVVYHGGLDAVERSTAQQLFITNKSNLVIATNAFGMGIDKKNIRFIVHFNLPANLEQYAQEAGRAGRDRKPATAYLLYNPANLAIHLGLIDKEKQKKLRQIKRKKLKKMQQYCKSQQCKQVLLAQHFGESITQCKVACSSCQPTQETHPFLIQLSDPKEKAVLKKLLELKNKTPTNLTSPLFALTDAIICQLALVAPQNAQSCRLLAGVGDGWMAQWWGASKKIILPDHAFV